MSPLCDLVRPHLLWLNVEFVAVDFVRAVLDAEIRIEVFELLINLLMVQVV